MAAPQHRQLSRADSATPAAAAAVLLILASAATAAFGALRQCSTLTEMTSGVWVDDPSHEQAAGYQFCQMDLRQDCRSRGDGLYLKHRWKPFDCEMRRIDTPDAVTKCLAGQRVAFVGDSLSRNMMVALQCLLATDPTEGGKYQGQFDGYRVSRLGAPHSSAAPGRTGRSSIIAPAERRDACGSHQPVHPRDHSCRSPLPVPHLGLTHALAAVPPCGSRINATQADYNTHHANFSLLKHDSMELHFLKEQSVREVAALNYTTVVVGTGGWCGRQRRRSRHICTVRPLPAATSPAAAT